MNIEENRIDVCFVISKSSVDDDHNTTNSTEGITPWISDMMTDSDREKTNLVPTEDSETTLMPGLTDNLQAAEEDNNQTQDTMKIDEVNGNKRSCAQESPPVDNPTDLILFNDEQHKTVIEEEKMKDSDSARVLVEEGDDGGDMDMGVDLSLDETGVLEAESANVQSNTNNILDFGSIPQDAASVRIVESQGDAMQTSSTETSATNQAGLYPLVEDVDNKQKPSGKKVTFPSDEDIVSGAVEPKDPWRHGNTCLFLHVCMCKLSFD